MLAAGADRRIGGCHRLEELVQRGRRHALAPRRRDPCRSSRALSARARRSSPRCAGSARTRGTSSAAAPRRRTSRRTLRSASSPDPTCWRRSRCLARHGRPRRRSPHPDRSRPLLASMTSATTSASTIARFAPRTLTISTGPPRATRPGRRIPAVSTIRKRRRCHASGESIASRVVPGMSLTSTRSSLSSRLTSDDLPTFGRPTMATVVARRLAARD